MSLYRRVVVLAAVLNFDGMGKVRLVGAGERRAAFRVAHPAFGDHLENWLSAVSIHVPPARRGEVNGGGERAYGDDFATEL